VPELISQARANPGRYTFASSGAGTTLHLSGELFKQMAGVDILHIPYRGGAPAQIDLLAGRVDMMFGNIPEAVRAFREGKVKALGVTGPQRSPQAPQIPAIGEFLPGYAVTSWGGVCGPAGIAPAIIARIAELGRQAVESRRGGLVGIISRFGTIPPRERGKLRAADSCRWRGGGIGPSPLCLVHGHLFKLKGNNGEDHHEKHHHTPHRFWPWRGLACRAGHRQRAGQLADRPHSLHWAFPTGREHGYPVPHLVH
jgi:hypothetical protein